MASIETLIDQIGDARLKAQIAREVVELKKRRPWGLVFERHLPENIRLFVAPIKVGSAVWERRSAKPRRLVVRAIEGEELVVTSEPPNTVSDADAPTERIARAHVLVEHDVATPIFPTLTPIGQVRNGPVESGAHAVIQGENYHALETLLVTHERAFDLIYLDPPYNTGNRDWSYNNDYVDPNDTYRPSKWLAFMERRLRLAERLLNPDGVLVVTIDENEVHHLGMLLEQVFPQARTQMVTISTNPSGSSRGGLSRVDEHAFFAFFGGSEPSPTFEDFFGPEDRTRARWWDNLMRGASAWVRAARPNQCYPILVNQDGKIVGAGEPFLDEDESARPTKDGELALVWPVRKDGRLGIWGIGVPRFRAMFPLGYVAVSEPRNGVRSVRYLLDGAVKAIEKGDLRIEGYDDRGGAILPKKQTNVIAKTMWHRARHTAGASGGTGMVAALVGGRDVFSFPKSVYAVRDTIDAAVGNRKDALICDFFAGSGTTLHATALLNARDGGRRRCYLVTNNELRAEDSTKLHKTGQFRGDPQFEAAGVFERACRPRVTAAITGVRPDGQPVEGKYLDGRAYAEGFAENVAFFRLDYLDPAEVEFGLRFRELQPLLWLWAGGVGEIEHLDPRKPLGTPKSAPYAVLFDPSGMPALLEHLGDRRDVRRVFIVSESDDGFDQLATDLPAGVAATCLYRDYLTPLRATVR
jgi:adenine-specific DNA-methyltransferase